MTRVFFTDRNLGLQFPQLLSDAGFTVERHRDHFPPTGTDEAWLELVGRRGWVGITHDRHIRYKANELGAVHRHGVALLLLVGKAPFPEIARSFVRMRERIESFLDRAPRPPFIAKIYQATPAELSRMARPWVGWSCGTPDDPSGASRSWLSRASPCGGS